MSLPRGLALALLGLGASACARSSAAEDIWVPLLRDDLVIEVDVTGTLRAVRSSPIGPSAAVEVSDFKISRMATEGAEVKKGQPVLSFDTSELERQLADRLTARDAAAQEVVKKQIDLDLARREGEMRVTEAEALQSKAKLKADLPPQYTAAIEVRLAKIDLESADSTLRMAKQRLGYAQKLGEAELTFLRERHARAERRVQATQQGIAALTVTSPVDGLVVYRQNWRGEKKKVGDSCWPGYPCIEVVDVSEMYSQGEVDETESAHVAVGQRVSFRLEALPEMEWTATVGAIRPNVFRQSAKTGVKVIGVDLHFEKTDPVRMRPGMQYRGRVETDRVPRALLVPIEAVFNRAEGPIAFRRTAGGGHERIALRLGRRNHRWAEVLGGLGEHDRVARRDLEQEEPAP